MSEEVSRSYSLGERSMSPVQEEQRSFASRADVASSSSASGWRAFIAKYYGALASVSALAIYTVVAWVYFWWPIAASPTTQAIGSGGPDVGQNYWYLRWWPYAISHGLNPFITYKIWYPYGYNLAWQTSLPGPSMLMAPIVSLTGVVGAYNILVVSSVVLTAWATYVLCYHLVRQFWASFIGGYLFGFSGFMVAQASGHIHLLLLYVIPISIYLYILRAEQRIGRVLYFCLAPLPLLFLFLTTVELFTFVAMFGYMAIALYWFFTPQQRKLTLQMAIETTVAFAICGVILSPYLYFMAVGYAKGIEHPLDVYSGDVLGFVIPTNLFFFFSNHLSRVPIAGGNGTEQDSYLGLPLALIMAAFGVKYFSKPYGKMLTVLTLIAVAFTLGPYITLANVQVIRSPMYYIYKLPILEKSLPIRYALFISLTGSLMAALWIAREVKRFPTKIALGLATMVMLIPNIATGPFVSPEPQPAFFTTTMYQQYIHPNDVVLMLPMGFFGNDMAWQQAANFSFTLSAGYGGAAPHSDDILPIDYMLYTGDATSFEVREGSKVVRNVYVYSIEHYIATRHVNDIVVEERVFAQWSKYLSFLHVTPQHVGGVWYYAIPSSFSLASLPGEVTPGDMLPRPYYPRSAVWDDQAQTLTVPKGTADEAAETLSDQFPSGNYGIAITVTSSGVSDAPVAMANITIDGNTATIPLANGTTHYQLHVPSKDSYVQIKIMGVGGPEFQIGNTVMSRAG